MLERAGTKNHLATWLCQCDCGNKTIVYGTTLRSGETTSCGCFKHESHNGIDETGNKYGKLTVLSKAPKGNGIHLFWHCVCECGTECDVDGTHLRNGTVQSCGCLKMSSGEQAIKNILDNNNIPYKSQYIFKDCLSLNGNPLRFDFAIFNKNNDLLSLIEYNGE